MINHTFNITYCVDDNDKYRWFGTRKTEEELLTSYNIQWLEVAVWRDKYDQENPAFLQDELPAENMERRKDKRSGMVLVLV